MINNDSVVTAYDEHLTLVEWLQKIEKLLANGGLKSTALNDKGNATFSLTLTFNDNSTITSPDMTLTSVNEALTALNNSVEDIKDGSTHLFETITDNNKNKRFIEGNIDLTSDLTNLGVVKKYGKWALSGNHLMIILSLDIPENISIPQNAVYAFVNMPTFIFNKLYGLWDIVLDVKNITARNTNNWRNNVITIPNVRVFKSGNVIVIASDAITIEANSTCRIQFDFIIDNE